MNLLNKISNIVKRAVVSLSNSDEKSISYCQVKYLEKVAMMENIYPYGMSANAPEDSIVLLFNIQSNEANLAGIPYSQQNRFKGLKTGEVILGSPKSGSYIKFLDNGDIEISAKGNLIVNADSSINLTSKGFHLVSQSMLFESGSFSFGFDTSGIFQGNGQFNFGFGGAAIARVGDSVVVDGVSGTITSGSTNNTSD